jgi:hypothetical protein
LNYWIVNGNSYNGQFNNIDQLVTMMNNWDINGNWTKNAATLTISGGDNTNDYGDMKITQLGTGSFATVELNTNLIPNGVALILEEGVNEVVFENVVDGCSDTIQVLVACVNSLYINSTINVNDLDTICLETEELLGNVVSVQNICADPSQNSVNFEQIQGTNCFSCLGMEPGFGSACFVICDEYGVCDTTTWLSRYSQQILHRMPLQIR